MKSLHTLIRLRKHEIDDKRKAMTALERALDRVQQQQRQLEETIDKERNTAKQSEAMGLLTYGAFLEQAKRQRESLSAQEQTVKAQVEEARAELQEAFRDLKTLEITQETREAEEAAKRNKAENDRLDEQGIQRHQRAKSDTGA